jgi:hypothetical protein
LAAAKAAKRVILRRFPDPRQAGDSAGAGLQTAALCADCVFACHLPLPPGVCHMYRPWFASLLVVTVLGIAYADEKSDDGFVTIFDGKSLDGWKINENEKAWKLEDGVLIANGDRSHIFYVGDDKPFKNFELKVDVQTKPHSNGGIFFHTKYQKEGWPVIGYEAQVNNTYDKDPQKTGGIYNTVKVGTPPAEDGKWWTQTVIVKDRHITVKVDDKVVAEYDEPADKKGADGMLKEKLSEGTFALQAHDPGSTVMYRNVRVKRLP